MIGARRSGAWLAKCQPQLHEQETSRRAQSPLDRIARMPSIVRSILAVIGGIAALSVVLFAAEPLTPASNATTASRLLWLAILTISMTAGGFITAWIAPQAKVGHAIGMALLQAAMTLVAMQMVRHASEPLWFWLGGVAPMIPSAWAGARMRAALRPV